MKPSSGWYCAATAAGLENSSLVSLISDWPLSTPGAIWPQVPHFSMAWWRSFFDGKKGKKEEEVEEGRRG